MTMSTEIVQDSLATVELVVLTRRPKGDPGDTAEVYLEFQVSATHIQYRTDPAGAWVDLIPLSEFVSVSVPIELQTSATHLQWRYQGDTDWIDAVLLTDLLAPHDHAGLYDPAGTAASAVSAHDTDAKHFTGTQEADLTAAKAHADSPHNYDPSGTAVSAVSAHDTDAKHFTGTQEADLTFAKAHADSPHNYDPAGTAANAVSVHDTDERHISGTQAADIAAAKAHADQLGNAHGLTGAQLETLLDAYFGSTDWRADPISALASLDTSVTGVELDALKTKVDSVESGAKDDQTAGEIEALLDAYYGSTDWRTGTSDHGALSGLADDDHSQYHTDARGDARYATLAQGALADTATQPEDLGTAALLNVGTGALNIVQLDSDGKLPAVDGSALTGISGGTSHDAVTVTDGTTVNLTLTGQDITAEVIPGAIDATALLNGPEANATADQTGAEIEGLLDAQLGGTDWKTGGTLPPSDDNYYAMRNGVWINITNKIINP